ARWPPCPASILNQKITPKGIPLESAKRHPALATGGSTNHLIHLPAIARSAGVIIDWEDFDRLSRVIPLIARVYPNGTADVNGFEDAGGPTFVIRELLDGGLMHADTLTAGAASMTHYTRQPEMAGNELVWREHDQHSRDPSIIASRASPFSAEGGFRILSGNLGRACIKVSAVAREHWTIEAPCRVFSDAGAEFIVSPGFDPGARRGSDRQRPAFPSRRG
ncbi:dihydroxy-acid dehydratase domain-containing protein, partial [Sphingobium sp. YR768]|uniref:dihydroxy-acid dehydratase domain-containing protein n=1 Tax=Sphingobium sp. YR768 TaxID=1884365 RepID=UPI0008C24E6C